MGSFCLKIVWCVLMALVFFHQPAAHAASCVPVKAGQDAAFGNPYWQSGYYKNSLMHPHTHETYPEVELTWSQSDASDLAGYQVVAEDAYTTDGSLSQGIQDAGQNAVVRDSGEGHAPGQDAEHGIAVSHLGRVCPVY